MRIVCRIKADKNKGITSITYNHLNLPKTVTTAAGIIYYTYTAAGTKLKKFYDKTSGVDETTDYIGGIQYTSGKLDFVQTATGRYLYTTNAYQYNLTDHLGNVRATVDENGAVVQADDYYPFGLTFNHGGTGDNLYKYNGKEEQGETGLYDYIARQYDPELGRFTSIDPLADMMRRYSPYAYAFDNPIRFVDHDGMAPESVVVSKQEGESQKDFNARAQGVQNEMNGFGSNTTRSSDGGSGSTGGESLDNAQKVKGDRTEHTMEKVEFGRTVRKAISDFVTDLFSEGDDVQPVGVQYTDEGNRELEPSKSKSEKTEIDNEEGSGLTTLAAYGTLKGYARQAVGDIISKAKDLVDFYSSEGSSETPKINLQNTPVEIEIKDSVDYGYVPFNGGAARRYDVTTQTYINGKLVNTSYSKSHH